jgi:hypothetical protein
MKWTKEKCKEEALKYKTRTEFQKYSWTYRKCIKNDWLDEVCSHMPIPTQKQKQKNYWTKDVCSEEALKYKTKSEFQKKSGSAYIKSLKNKWLELEKI